MQRMKKAALLMAGVSMAAWASIAHAAYTYDTFTNMDIDTSGYLESGEYVNYAFGKADWDKDGYLEDTEWAKYTEVYYDPYDLRYEAYSYYDTDGDGMINRVEFDNFPTASLVAAWDGNDDNRVDTNEWDRVVVYYSDRR